MAIAQFLEYLQLEKNYSVHTLTAYKSDLDTFGEFIAPQEASPDFINVNYNEIRAWIVALSRNGHSKNTINRKISSLKSYYKFLQKTEQLKISPLARHQSLKTEKKIQVPFSEEEVKKSLTYFDVSTFEGIRDRFIIELLYATGIRRTELINVKLADLDLEAKILKVLGKRNKERYVPLLESVTITARKYLNARAEIESEKSDSYVFLTLKGVKIYESLVYRLINNYFSAVSSKLKKSPHILRHSFATHLLNHGANLNAVKELLGHASLASTQVYTHNSIAELNKVHKTAHPRGRKK